MVKIPLSDVPPMPDARPCEHHPDVMNEPHLVLPRKEVGEVSWAFRDNCEKCDSEMNIQRSIDLRIKSSGISPKYQDLTWDSFETDHATLKKQGRVHTAKHCQHMEKLKAWLINWTENWKDNYASGSSWVFSGPPGGGKTHLAATVCQEVIRGHMVTPIMTTMVDLFLSIKATFKKGGRAEMDRLKEIANYPLLVLDEVGLHTDTDWAFEKLSYIVHERINNLKPTIYITNVGEQKWQKALGDRITDRFLDDSMFRVVTFTFPSFRTGKKK